MAAVPTILDDLLQGHTATPLDLSSVPYHAFRADQAVSANLIERVKAAWGVDIVQGWGMTETSPMCVLSFPPPRGRAGRRGPLARQGRQAGARDARAHRR
jgi:fatty-acyl-CoA synthase